MINTSAKIGKITYNGRNIKLLAGSQTVTSGSIVIRVADTANTQYQLLDVDLNVLQTKTVASTGGIVDFTLSSTGTYFVKNVTKNWQKVVSVDQIGVYNVRGDGILKEYTMAQIHDICQRGYFSAMFELKDTWVLNDEDSIFNGYAFFVENVTQNADGTETAWFRMLKVYSGATYNINPYFYYLKSLTATSFTSQYSSVGGPKYSIMRQRMQRAGEDAWSQAIGIKPDGYTGTSTGIEFSKLYYTDGGGKTSSIYDYNIATDQMTALEEFTVSSSPRFVKGYFKNIGTITEDEFNAGYYYTYGSNVYTLATTYSSSTTYYGFYETLQEDGIFYNAFKSIKDYMVLIERNYSTGSTNTSVLTTMADYVDLPVIEEMFGHNRTTKLKSGTAATSAGFYNIPGEGEKLEVYDYDQWTTGQTYWTWSVYSGNTSYFCCVNNYGYCNDNYVTHTGSVRPGFRIN